MAQTDLDFLVGFTPSQEAISKLADAIATAFAKGSQKGQKQALAQFQSVVAQLGQPQGAMEARALAEAGITSLQHLAKSKKVTKDPVVAAYVSAARETLQGSVLNPATSRLRAISAARQSVIPPSAAAQRRMEVMRQQAESFVYLLPAGAHSETTVASASQDMWRKASKRIAELATMRDEAKSPEERAALNRQIQRQANILRSNIFAYKDVDERSDLTERLIAATEENTKATTNSTSAFAQFLTKGAIVGAIGQATQLGVNTLMSMWQQDVDRNVYSSAAAYRKRWANAKTAGGAAAGGALGAAIGAAIASYFSLGAGAGAGAWVGGGIGSVVGSGIGQLAGNFDVKRYAAYLKSLDYAKALRKDYYTLGGPGYNLSLAAEESGIAQAASISQMRWSAQTLPGAMALGMVGEQDMLMLSLMPEYFAALMNGADPATLLEAYQKSVKNLPPQLQPLVATMAPGGSQDLYAAALDPLFNRFIRGYGTRPGADSLYLQDVRGLDASAGWASAAQSQGYANRARNTTEFLRDTQENIESGDGMFYDVGLASQEAIRTFLMLSGSKYGWDKNDKSVSEIFETWGNMLDRGELSKVTKSLDSFLGQGIQIELHIDDEFIMRERMDSTNAPDGRVSYNIGAQ